MFILKKTSENIELLNLVVQDNVGVVLDHKIKEEYIEITLLNNDPYLAVKFSEGSVKKKWLELLETKN